MAVIQGKCSHETATKLAAAVAASLGALQATVNGRQAIVTAKAWDPIIGGNLGYEVHAELIDAGQGRNFAADAAAADQHTLELISRQITWESWPSS